MIIRNTNDEIVQETTYKAHGGGIARMLLTNKELRSMLFLADASLAPGKTIETHIDPYEEIYYILEGEGVMMVGDDERRVIHPQEHAATAVKKCTVLINYCH